MVFIFFLFIVFIGGGWLIGKLIGNLLVPGGKPSNTSSNKTTIHNHFTENHLHISKENLKYLIEDKSNFK